MCLNFEIWFFYTKLYTLSGRRRSRRTPTGQLQTQRLELLQISISSDFVISENKEALEHSAKAHHGSVLHYSLRYGDFWWRNWCGKFRSYPGTLHSMRNRHASRPGSARLQSEQRFASHILDENLRNFYSSDLIFTEKYSPQDHCWYMVLPSPLQLSVEDSDSRISPLPRS